jgi:RNA recognition motif-containing protein
MSKKLFVGNLPFEVNDADLATVLNVAGKVIEARVILNKKTGRSKGYGFVEMETEEMAQDAVRKFEGATLNERALTVQLATPKQESDAKEDDAKKHEAQPAAEATQTS